MFSFGQLVEWRGDIVRLQIPTTIAPRYGRPDMRPHAVPVTALDTVRRATLRVIASGDANWRASSPSHSLIVSPDDNGLVIAPEGGAIPMDRDIVIDLTGSEFRPMSVMVKDGDRHLVVASFQVRPERHRESSGRILKILIDCSGSMDGISIAQAGKGLEAILQALTPEDHFSVSQFGSSIHDVTHGVVPASPANVERALRVARSMKADLGGTEMRKALISMFEQSWPQRVAEEADLLLITDGQSWNDQDIVKAARRSRHRVFTIGVGAASAEHLLRHLGESTGGACEIVTPRDGMAERVLRQFDRMDARRLAGRIEWADGARDAWPEKMQTIFAGDTIHTAAWFDREPLDPVKFIVLNEGTAIDSQVPEEPLQMAGHLLRPMAQLAAQRLIDGVEDEALATELAVRYGLLSAHTHLVMVGDREAKLTGLPKLRIAHQMMPESRGHNLMLVESRSDIRFSRPSTVAYCRSPSLDYSLEPEMRQAFTPPSLREQSNDQAASKRKIGLIDRLMNRVRRDRQSPTWAFSAALADAVGRLDALDFQMLRAVRIPEKIVIELEKLVIGSMSERDVVLVFLYAIISAPDGDQYPRGHARSVRAAFGKLKNGRLREIDPILAEVNRLISHGR